MITVNGQPLAKIHRYAVVHACHRTHEVKALAEGFKSHAAAKAWAEGWLAAHGDSLDHKESVCVEVLLHAVKWHRRAA